MAYFLGRDVKVAVAVEDTTNGFNNALGVASVEADPNSTANGDVQIRTNINVGTGVGLMADVTSVDLTLGAVDEDIAYMGQRTALKAEIKKETTVVLTRKQKDAFWSDMWARSFRWGCTQASLDAADTAAIGLAQPEAPDFGFRVIVALKDGGEVVSIAGMTFSEYTTSLNTDGVTEETLTFNTHVTPKVAAAEDITIALGSTPFLL